MDFYLVFYSMIPRPDLKCKNVKKIHKVIDCDAFTYENIVKEFIKNGYLHNYTMHNPIYWEIVDRSDNRHLEKFRE